MTVIAHRRRSRPAMQQYHIHLTVFYLTNCADNQVELWSSTDMT